MKRKHEWDEEFEFGKEESEAQKNMWLFSALMIMLMIALFAMFRMGKISMCKKMEMVLVEQPKETCMSKAEIDRVNLEASKPDVDYLVRKNMSYYYATSKTVKNPENLSKP